MNRIIKIGMDVHSTNYTLCAMEPTIGSEDRIFGELQVAPDYKEIIAFIDTLKLKLGLDNKVPWIYLISSAYKRRIQLCHSCSDNHAYATGAACQNR